MTGTLQDGSFTNVIELERSPSLWHAGLLIVVHHLTLVALVMSPMPENFKLALGFCVFVSAVHSVSEALLLPATAIVGLRGAKGVWLLSQRDGKLLVATVRQAIVYSTFVSINFEINGRLQTVSLFADALSKDHHRKARACFEFCT